MGIKFCVRMEAQEKLGWLSGKPKEEPIGKYIASRSCKEPLDWDTEIVKD